MDGWIDRQMDNLIESKGYSISQLTLIRKSHQKEVFKKRILLLEKVTIASSKTIYFVFKKIAESQDVKCKVYMSASPLNSTSPTC